MKVCMSLQALRNIEWVIILAFFMEMKNLYLIVPNSPSQNSCFIECAVMLCREAIRRNGFCEYTWFSVVEGGGGGGGGWNKNVLN